MSRFEGDDAPVRPVAAVAVVGREPDAREADQALVEAMAAGDQDSLRALCEQHGPYVLSYLVGQLGDRAVAEEVAQDVMLAAWRGARTFRAECRVRTWLLAIAHHRSVSVRRRRRAAADSGQAEDPSHCADSGSATRTSELRVDLTAALRRLPADHRAALDLVFFHGLSLDEAARVLDVAPGTVKSRLHRARAALRAQLGVDYERGM